MQDTENLKREQTRLQAENQFLRGRIENLESCSNEDGSAKGTSKKGRKNKELRVNLTPVRVTDENLNPARKKPNDDR